MEQITPSDEFNDWDLQYEAWKELTLTVEDPQVSIVIFSFLNFNLFFIIYESCQTLLNTPEHFQTSIFQKRQMQMTLPGPATPPPALVPVPVESMLTGVVSAGMETKRRSSTCSNATPLKKKYRCMKCSHPPFLTKYGIVEHVNVKHQSMGIECDICGNIMSAHHLEDHKDHHTLSNRYICQETNRKIGKICLTGCKQRVRYA